MRIGALLCLFICVPLAVAAQDDKPRVPKKGDSVEVEGCLHGSAVEHAQATLIDAEGNPKEQEKAPTLTYRLDGDKKLLKELKEKHDRKVVKVRGVLQSDLIPGGLATNVGKTRINIGVNPGSTRGQEPVPVLQARSFEGTTVTCAK
jgi:hypothetical protein